MADNFEMPRAVLRAIARASGDSYRFIDGPELVDELAKAGVPLDDIALYNLMFRLRDDGDYVEFYATGGMEVAKWANIKLAGAGRQEVEGWPSEPGKPTGADVEALLTALDERADDAATSARERNKARVAAGALRDLGAKSALASQIRLTGRLGIE
jgi:hypothetical protein